MSEGDIVLVLLPQADRQNKNRPGLILRQMPGFGDLLVCGISSQVRQEVAGFDEIIDPSHRDFVSSGLKCPPLIRLGFFSVLPANQVLGIIGTISSQRHQLLLSRLSQHLRPKGI
jgi:mRNA interferase MazF